MYLKTEAFYGAVYMVYHLVYFVHHSYAAT